MERHVVLLRGINVGGHRKVPMARLREVLTAAGYDGVRTYVQSGNVVLGADGPPAELERRLAAELEAAFGFDIAVMVRTAGELAAVVAANPIPEAAGEPSRYHVLFLSGEVPGDPLGDLDPGLFATDRLALDGRHLYVWTPDGLRDSRLMRALTERRLGVRTTARNWRTVLQLQAMTGDY